MLAVEAQYFGENEQPPLFGLLQPSLRAVSREEVVLICYPLPQEMMRSYWAHRQVSLELAKQGFANLRFDYFATGDSLGEGPAIDLIRWQEDIRAAYRYLKIKSRSPKISVFGTRLGATLACHALADLPLHRLVLWDPIPSGRAYREQLDASHQAMVAQLFNRTLDARAIAKSQEWLGFVAPPHLRQQLEELDWKWPTRAKAIHIISCANAQSPLLQQPESAVKANLQYHQVQDEMLWQDPLALKMQAFPQQLLQCLARLFEGQI